MTTRCRISTTTIVLCVLTLMAVSANAQNAGSDSDHPPEITNSIGMKLKLIPAGEFLMGTSDADVAATLKADSNIKEEYLKGERPQHRVKISRPFYAGVYEVTQGEYKAVMGTNPSWVSSSGGGSEKVSGQNTDRFPVETVSWYDAVEFCNKLSTRDDLSPYYSLTSVERADGIIYSAVVVGQASSLPTAQSGYRLPTEAEWEYMCRGNTRSAYWFGNVLNGDKANVDGNYPFGTTTKGSYLERPTTVGSYAANPFGLYDTHGNVWEYMCRGNTRSAYWFGNVLNGDKANVDGNYPFGTTTKGSYLERPTTVGSYAANPFGLYDTHGNVWEWCDDVYDESAYGSRSGTTENPFSSSGSESRVLRGGSWYLNSRYSRSAVRSGSPPVLRGNGYGFRVVR